MSKARDLAGIFNLNPTSGTTAQRPVTAEVGEIYYNGTTGKTQIYTPTGWQDMASGIPYGNTAGRPAAVTGQPYFNGETARLEMYTATGWQNIVQEVPGVSSITGNYSEATNSGTITIQGTNFVSGAIASAIGTNGVEVLASSTTYNSLVQIVAVFTGLSNANEPYDIKVTNPSNLFGLIPDALYVNASPVWQTASGSLGTFNEQVSITLSALSATDSDSNTITYALASGSTLPSGVTLNSSTGVISGTLPDISTNTTYTFSINASDGTNTIPRTFSISSVGFIDAEILAIGGGGAGGSSATGAVSGGGGGAGGYLEGVLSITKGSTYAINIGSGGVGSLNSTYAGNIGGDTSFGSYTAFGGGAGGFRFDNNNYNAGSAGGSSGGGAGWASGVLAPSASTQTSQSPLTGYGNVGGSGNGGHGGSGGGGGAGAAAANAPIPSNTAGGIGRQSSITGTATYYAGGGGGGAYTQTGPNAPAGAGGLGGGGTGGYQGSIAATAGTANTGGGGGGCGNPGSGVWIGANGGSGVLIIAYPNTQSSIATIPGTLTYTLDTTTRSGYKVYKFTAGSGTVTF